MIIDSSSLFDLVTSSPPFTAGLPLQEESNLVPTPVVAETYYGVATAWSNTTEEEVRNRLLGYPRVEVDEEIARTAGELLATADDRVGGNAGVRPNDTYIAAMAEVLDDAVLTANTDDFGALGVPVETY